MKTLAVVAMAALTAISAKAAEPIKIKGFYIGMGKDAATKTIRGGLSIKTDTDTKPYDSAVFGEYTPTGFYQARLYFKEDTLRSFTLTQGYFDAAHFPQEDFVRAIVDNYRLKASCRTVFNQVAVLLCTAVGPDGERIDVGGGEVEVTGASAGKPSFD